MIAIILSAIIPFLVALTILAFVHELGHFYYARKYGVKVEVFSIGMGPEVFGWTDKLGTRWRFSAIPIGGYVRMFGDIDETSRPNPIAIENMDTSEKNLTLETKTVWQRMMISFAGPMANFIFAFFIMVAVFFIKGEPQLLPVVSEIIDKSPAERANLSKGDLIISVNHTPVSSLNEYFKVIREVDNDSLQLEVQKIDGTNKTVNITYTEGDKKGQIGFIPSPSYSYKSLTFLECLYKPIVVIINFSITFTMAIGQLVTKAISKLFYDSSAELNMGGPLAIAEMAAKTMDMGIWTFIWFMAILSLNLGFFNLLPLPILDGGHILFYWCEVIMKRPVSEKTQEKFYKAGFFIIALLFLASTYADVVRMFFKKS